MWTSVSNLTLELKSRQEKIIPVIIQVYGDKSFDFTKQPPVAIQLWKLLKSNPVPQRLIVRKVASITWGSSENNRWTR